MAEFHNGSQRVYSEVAGVLSPYISLAKTGQMTRLDPSGVERIISHQRVTSRGGVTIILNEYYHLHIPSSPLGSAKVTTRL